MTYASVRRMKKIYNLFSWVVVINLMVVMGSWWTTAFAESEISGESPGVVEEVNENNETAGEVGDENDGGGEIEHNDENEDDSESLNVELPILYIKAVNPGYKIDGVNNVGEMIEIGKSSDAVVSLADLTVRYTNSSGKETVLVEFPENSYMIGESLLLRLGSAPMSELSNLIYNTTLALKAGPIALLVNDDMIDSVCWNGKDECEREFISSTPTTLVRNLETGEFEHVQEYEPEYSEDGYVIIEPAEDEENGENGLDDDDEENNNESELDDEDVEGRDQMFDEEDATEVDDVNKENKKTCSEGYYLYEPTGRCRKIVVEEEKTCAEGYYLNDVTGRCKKIVIEEEKACKEGYYLNEETGRCKKIVIEEEKTCAEGYYLNEATGRCKKIVVEEEKTCKEGYYLNEETGRCRKIVVEEEKTCAEGQYLNPLTGRCKKIEVEVEKTCAEGYYLNEATGRCKKIVVEEKKICKEGYYLNEETGRCRKIVENNGANYELTPENYEESSSFVALYAVLGVLGVGAIYVVYEFRREIKRCFKKLFGRK